MDWKGHLKWGFIVLTIMIIVQILHWFWYPVEELAVFGGSKLILFSIAIPNLIIAYAVGIYASLIPDVDIGTSKAFAITYMILIILALYFAFTEYIMGLFTSLIIMALILGLKHRGIMHKSYTGLVLGTIFGWLFSSILVGLYFALGFMVHLICDRRKSND